MTAGEKQLPLDGHCILYGDCAYSGFDTWGVWAFVLSSLLFVSMRGLAIGASGQISCASLVLNVGVNVDIALKTQFLLQRYHRMEDFLL